MANREAASSRSSWQRVRDAITAGRVLAYVLMPLLLLCAFASLIALNLLLRDLWGELAYAILVTGVALWAFSQTQVVTRLFERLGVAAVHDPASDPLVDVRTGCAAGRRRLCTQEEDAEPTADCLQPIPITAEGLAASWNAFRGRWGRQTCILAGAYCDTSKAPGSPAGQPRYRDPGRPGAWLCVADPRLEEPLPELEDCGDEVDPDTEIPT